MMTVETAQDLVKIARIAAYDNIHSDAQVRAALCEVFDRVDQFINAAVDLVFMLRAVTARKP